LLAGATAVVPIPAYMAAADVWANDASIITIDDLGIKRDYTTGLFVPPWGPVLFSGLGTSVTIANTGAVPALVFFQATLEP